MTRFILLSVILTWSMTNPSIARGGYQCQEKKISTYSKCQLTDAYTGASTTQYKKQCHKQNKDCYKKNRSKRLYKRKWMRKLQLTKTQKKAFKQAYKEHKKTIKLIKKQLKTTHHSIQTLYLEPNLDNTQLTALKQQLIHLHEQKIDHKFTYLKSLKELLSEKQFNLYIKKHCEKKKCY